MVIQVSIGPDKARNPNVLTDDTEEDLVGTDLHQRAIRTLCENLLHVQEKRGAPWHVGMQLTTLMGDVPGKKDWRPSPDVLAHLTAGPGNLSSLDAVALGAPHLVIEVLSESTWAYDLGKKKTAYYHAGVQEYLVFDPTTEYLGTDVRAWRRAPRSLVPWRAEANGRWHSRVIDVSLHPQSMLLRVTDRDGQLMPTLGEAVRLAERERLVAEQERRAAEQERRRADDAVRLAEEQARQIAALQAALEAQQREKK